MSDTGKKAAAPSRTVGELLEQHPVKEMLAIIERPGVVSGQQLVTHHFVDAIHGPLPRPEALNRLKADMGLILKVKPNLGTITVRSLPRPSFGVDGPCLVASWTDLPQNAEPASPSTPAPIPLHRHRALTPDDHGTFSSPHKAKAAEDRTAPADTKLYYSSEFASWIAQKAAIHNQAAERGALGHPGDLTQQLGATEFFLTLREQMFDPKKRPLETYWSAVMQFGLELTPQAVVSQHVAKAPKRYYSPEKALASVLEYTGRESDKVAIYVVDPAVWEDKTARDDLQADLAGYCKSNGIGYYLIIK